MTTVEGASRIAVLQLPGVNCEPETARALRRAGLAAEVVRWTRNDLDGFDGFVLPGGFSFQDRVRAGAVAAREPVLELVAAAAAAGKPVLGICNGAQVLVEAGLVPGLDPGSVEMGIAPNRMPDRRGYHCAWSHLRIETTGTAASAALSAGAILPIPYAHAEGCFVSRDPEVVARLAEPGHVVFRYCRPDGTPAGGFPHNPNGSIMDAAGIANREGNVVALMPHPERASFLHQVAWELPGSWGDRRRQARNTRALREPGPGLGVFESLRVFLGGREVVGVGR